MHRIDADAHVGNLFSEGDPVVPTAATQVDDDWLNAVQEEIVNGVIDPGTALVKGTNTQLANAIAMILAEPGGRLCVSNATPPDSVVDDTADVVFYVPHKHNRVPLWNGTRWELKTLPDAGSALIAVGDTTLLAANTNFDVFLWSNAGTLAAMVGPAWTSGTARGAGAGTTELERKDGRWVNKVAISGGPAAQRGLYVGTIRTDGSSLVPDTAAKRFVWNAYNRVDRTMRAASEPQNNWSYSSATIREAFANTANRLQFVIGLDEDQVVAEVVAQASVLGDGAGFAYVGIGLDATNAYASGCLRNQLFLNTANGAHAVIAPLNASWRGRPGIGSHFLSWLEQSNATGATFYGDNNFGSSTGVQNGISGSLRA